MSGWRPRRARRRRRGRAGWPRRARRPGQSVEALARRHRARALRCLLLAAVVGYAALHALGYAALALSATAAVLALAGAHRWRLAGRWDVGAASERAVAGELRRLELRGWLVWHDLDKPRGGNVDHLAVAPGGAAFALETKTARYRRAHLAQAHDGANWAARRLGLPVTAVLCLAQGNGRPRLNRGVVVCGARRLAGLLERGAGPAAPSRRTVWSLRRRA